MTDSPLVQGGLICAAAALAALIFGGGLLSGSWWAVAIPVGIGLAFLLGLVFWVGWTIATVDVEPEVDPGAEDGSEADADGAS